MAGNLLDMGPCYLFHVQKYASYQANNLCFEIGSYKIDSFNLLKIIKTT